MIPTLSSRGRPGSAEAAYWRRHPPTSWMATQALLLEAADPVISMVVSDPVTESPAVPAPLEAPPAPAMKPESAQPASRDWLPLLVLTLVVLIDAATALWELASPWAGIWHEKAPWSRQDGRTQGAVTGAWPAPLVGLP
jgi:hypothetical protein